jgi:hypothetical protein
MLPYSSAKNQAADHEVIRLAGIAETDVRVVTNNVCYQYYDLDAACPAPRNTKGSREAPLAVTPPLRGATDIRYRSRD